MHSDIEVMKLQYNITKNKWRFFFYVYVKINWPDCLEFQYFPKDTKKIQFLCVIKFNLSQFIIELVIIKHIL